MSNDVQTKPNGPVAAVFLAAGIGAFVLGLMVVLAEASKDIAAALDFSKNYGLGSGVGPLSGKVTIATLAFVVSWIVAFFALRGKEVSFGRFFAAAVILVAIGFLFTFPPFFTIFAPAG